jgi:hypothetical protein
LQSIRPLLPPAVTLRRAPAKVIERAREPRPELGAASGKIDTPAEPGLSSARRHWSLDDIPWHSVGHDLYTENLVEYFAGDEEVTSWLTNYWLPEELQHGRALRRYVETIWPDFDWEPAYRRFVEEFRPYCDTSLESARSLEMASRCVVEMGTACYYTTLFRASPDPVLALLARRIADDEVRHYKHFYRYFRNYRDAERPGRAKVVPALWRRLRMTGGDDSFIVLKHVYGAHRPGESFNIRVYRSVRREGRDLVRDHFPHEMSVRMLFKPLALGPRTLRAALPVAVAIARRLVP